MAEKPKSSKKKSQGRLVLAGALVGLLGYLYWKHRQASQAGSSQSGMIGTLPSAMPGGAESNTTQIGGGPTSFNSLTDWMSHVQGWANSLGFDAATVQTALQDYSVGQCLSPTQYKIIDQALGLFGQPPGAPYQGVVQCQPTPTATTGDFVAGTGSGHEFTYLRDLQSRGVIPGNTIPVYGTAGNPNGESPARTLTFGSAVKVTGPPVIGPWLNGLQATFYPVEGGGYVSAADIAAQSQSPGNSVVFSSQVAGVNPYLTAAA